MNELWLTALFGGGLIGLSASIMLLFNGRVTGISGFFYGSTINRNDTSSWKMTFLLGMIASGFILKPYYPQNLLGHIDSELWTLAVGGLLVGYGTRLGSGCTSGHGVCGVSRLSMRSILATLTFMVAGILSVTFFRWAGVIQL